MSKKIVFDEKQMAQVEALASVLTLGQYAKDSQKYLSIIKRGKLVQLAMLQKTF